MFVQESSDEEKGLTFAEVLPKEIEVLRKARRKREVPERPVPLEQDIVGLAFSGGGIRSATFNLGVIQALASKNLLKFVDYFRRCQAVVTLDPGSVRGPTPSAVNLPQAITIL